MDRFLTDDAYPTETCRNPFVLRCVTRESPKIAVTVKRNRSNMENGVTLDRRIPNAKVMPFQPNYGVCADDVNRTYCVENVSILLL